MYGAKDLNIDNLKELVNDDDIFRYYINEPWKVGVKFRSELRTSNGKSCYIFPYQGKLLYKDYKTGKTYNSFMYVMEKFSLTLPEALAVINNDFQLGLYTRINRVGLFRAKGTGVRNPDFDINKVSKKSAAVIEVNVRKWNGNVDKQYWGQYDFTVADLTWGQIYPLNYFTLNGSLYSGGRSCYGYYHGQAKDGRHAWKILKPHADKSRKWLSNVPQDMMQGYNQLPKSGSLLVITKALKDIIVLHKLGIASVAPQGENNNISEEQMTEYRSRFKQIVVFYDNDEAGRKGAEKVAVMHAIPKVFIPESTGEKDPSDFVFTYNYSKFVDVLNGIGIWKENGEWKYLIGKTII